MLMVPAEVLNGIQATGRMVNPELSDLFSMSAGALAKRHDELAEHLQKQGLDRPTALAYLDVMPLLVERRAISAYLNEPGNEELRQALPNLETPGEAAILGTKNRNLRPQQSVNLLQALEHVFH
jgi:hypothetical protein